LSTWCLATLPGAFLQTMACRPWASTSDPQWHLWGTHRVSLSSMPTATRILPRLLAGDRSWRLTVWRHWNQVACHLRLIDQRSLDSGTILRYSRLVPERLFAGHWVWRWTKWSRPLQLLFILRIFVVWIKYIWFYLIAERRCIMSEWWLTKRSTREHRRQQQKPTSTSHDATVMLHTETEHRKNVKFAPANRAWILNHANSRIEKE